MQQRAWMALFALVLAIQLAHGQKELAGAMIDGADLCPPGAKQAPAPAAPQRSSSGLGRVFSRKQAPPPAPTPAPACRLAYKYCGEVGAVAARCRATPGCRAFSYDGRCGYLKSSSGPRKARVGWSTYVLS